MKNVIIVIIAFIISIGAHLWFVFGNSDDVEFSHPLNTVPNIEELYIELDRLLALRKDVQDKIDKIELRPDGSRSTITVGSPKDYEDLTKLNAEINTLMGVIGDLVEINNFNEVYLKNSH